jgi:hypothetical protein
MMHARVKDVSADRIRLGHALHGGPGAVAEALEISLGKQRSTPVRRAILRRSSARKNGWASIAMGDRCTHILET